MSQRDSVLHASWSGAIPMTTAVAAVLLSNDVLGQEQSSKVVELTGVNQVVLVNVWGCLVNYGSFRDTTGAAAGGPAGVASSALNQMMFRLYFLNLPDVSTVADIEAGGPLTEWLGFTDPVRCSRELPSNNFVYCLYRQGTLVDIEGHGTEQAVFHATVCATFEARRGRV